MDDVHALFEAITDSAVLLDRSGRIVDWNQGATTLFGYPKKEVLGRSVNLIYQNSQPFQRIIQDILPQQKRWHAETPFIRKNGSRGICKTSIALINFSAPQKLLALITHHNISQQKTMEATLEKSNQSLFDELTQSAESLYFSQGLLIKHLIAKEQLEKSLRESERRFHSLAENITDIISRHSPDGKYLYASPSCKTLLGYTPEELLGMNAYRLLHRDDSGKLKKAFNRRKDNSNNNIVTYRIRHKDGEYRWFESTIRFIRDEETNAVSEIQSASRDVTDRILDKKARLRGQQLAHVYRLSTMEEMASGMAHEISQPLAAIVNYTQGCVRHLKQDSLDSTQLIEIMNKAVSQAQRAGEVIHRLKNFFCKGQLVKTTCKINTLIRETVSLIRNEITLSKTRIEFDLSKDVQLIYADRIQIQQVVLNLIQNAIEAMRETHPKHRKIQIKTNFSTHRFIEISVSDSGPGFSKEMAHKVFEPFFTTKAHGRGMGLAICRSIIEAHGGQFTITPASNAQAGIRFVLPIN